MERVKKYRWVLVFLVLLSVFYFFSLPKQLFHSPYSTILEDKYGQLLSASIATDGQWRFPEQNQIPKKFEEAIVLYEDKRFHSHIGVDVISLGRAIKQNLKAGRVISGGSTLTMQTIRLSRKNRSRTFFEKTIEIILATRLEFRYSKKEILSLYASHAPFGGNVVGLEGACWRYFGRKPDELSWAEASLLAVLPNNPSLIHLSKNRDKLKAKRDRLLQRLATAGKMDDVSLRLAKDEPLPDSPLPLPTMAPHLLVFASTGKLNQTKILSSLDFSLQKRATEILRDHHQRLRGNKINNAAIVVAEVSTGRVLAYVGNTEAGIKHHGKVDVVQAARSSGSILKPFLYAALLDDGKILSRTLQPDIPTIINGFAPQNFSRELDGAVPASQALIRSLNIPAVYGLRSYRYEKFYELLKNIGLTTLQKPADHYGLSLILGGAETTLWDVTGAYASMARSLNHYFDYPGKNRYTKKDFHPLTFLQADSIDTMKGELEENSWISASASYLTFDVLKELYRPGEETGWRLFNSTKKIAWKTGTSHGFRDAWAVGVNPDYVVGVWVGNADGEGRPGLTGTEAAAPILFDVFSLLPGRSWFQLPQTELERIPTCSQSGFRWSENCQRADTIWVTKAGLNTPSCPYHKKVYLSSVENFRVNLACEQPDKMVARNWFVLPPVQEYYYKAKHSAYQVLPAFRKDCNNPNSIAQMDIAYPQDLAKIFIPKELDGTFGKVILEATHRNPSTTIYWHVDGVFVKSSQKSHQLALNLTQGQHKLTLMDDRGETLERIFWVLSK
jgi:penicillin-binding protein 1C